MLRTSFITCAWLAASSAAAAQTPALDQAPAQQQAPAPPATPGFVIVEGNLKAVVRLFEIALGEALNQAGTDLQTWARAKVGPDYTVNMAPAALPKVSAILLPDNSLAFDIHLAEMNVTAYDITMRMRELQQQQAQQTPPDKSVDGRVRAAGLVKPDPVGPVPKGGTASASQQYSDYVRDALLKAMVDQAYLLPIGPGQMLTVQVTPVDVAVTNIFDKNPSRKLILSIKGDDLEAFRQKRLTREQLVLRIIDRRF